METGDIILYGGIAVAAFLFISKKSAPAAASTPVVAPGVTSSGGTASNPNAVVPGTNVTQSQLNSAGTGIANIIKAISSGGSSTPAASTPAASTPAAPASTIPAASAPVYTPSDPLISDPLTNPLITEPSYTDPIDPYTTPVDTTLGPPDTSFESDDDSFNGIPVMSVIKSYATNPRVTSKRLNDTIGCMGQDGLIGLLTFN